MRKLTFFGGVYLLVGLTALTPTFAEAAGACPCQECVLASGLNPGPLGAAGGSKALEAALYRSRQDAIDAAKAAVQHRRLCAPDCHVASNVTYDVSQSGMLGYRWEVRGDCADVRETLPRTQGYTPSHMDMRPSYLHPR